MVMSPSAQPGPGDEMTAVIDRLRLLDAVQRGLPRYYQALLQQEDVVLRVSALVALLELRAVWSDQAEQVVGYSRYGAVKRRAFPFFMEVQEFDLAARVAHIASEDVDNLLTLRMEAELRLDYARMQELDWDLFLAHGSPDYLWDAQLKAEQGGGWRDAVPATVRGILARPADSLGAFHLLSRLRNANQPQLVTRACDLFARAKLFAAETAVFRAALLLDSGEFERASSWLQRMPDAMPSESLTELALQLKAEALHKLRRYREAHSAYEKMNAVARSTTVDARDYRKVVEFRAKLSIDEVHPDPRERDCPTLTGFPRSATTLLENVLEAHPHIEAFEEIPAFSRLTRFAERYAAKTNALSGELVAKGKDLYFDEIRRNAKKPGARIYVDKLPTCSADAVFLKKVFPEKKYIFSIRHPYDVVLSCFRQTFVKNIAMENFRTLAEAAALYDFTMTQWFSVHSLDDASVCYVRYEQLVNEFQPTVERVLEFMGAEWDDAILGFAESADRRYAKTPSYQKVRSGLSIGVQSSWQNYKFVFETKETAVLKKWVEHFGYPV